MRHLSTLRTITAPCILTCVTGIALASDRPNILLFTADDLHAESLGVYGGRPADLTPNLDAFAAEAMRFDRAHVNAAICAPCRAIIATGRYSHRSGAMGFMPAREDVPDIVTTLQAAGYIAGILGKVGHSTPKKSMTWNYRFDRKELGNGRNPEIYYQLSKTFLEQSKRQGKPFYFMVNSHDPHRPYCNPDKLTRGAAMPSRTYQPSEVEVPGFLPDLPGVRAELAHYLNSTRRLDDTFGKVMQALRESGCAGNTLVVFISDNGIAVPFAKCNTWFHSSRTPMLVRWPGRVEPGSRNDRDFVSTVDFFPTFLEVTGDKGPGGLDGHSFMPLLKNHSQDGRQYVFTQIDSKAGGDAVPMRCVQNAQYGYIYNPFSDGKHWYRNNNEGKTMAAMQMAAKTDPQIAARIELFRYRVPEELYDLEHDPDCLHNLIDEPDHRATVESLQAQLVAHMQRTNDPMLKAFQHRTDRAVVDKVLRATYGPLKEFTKKKKNTKKRKQKIATDGKPRQPVFSQ
jgi:N-sulfoglucosamine sulfohydrolase